MAKDTRKTAADRGDDDVQKVAIVPNPDTAAGAASVGPALTEGQRAGLDPLDPKKDAEQAANRMPLTNMQTDHERENALDPISGGPSPGITEQTPLTAKQQGAPPTDMSGRPPMQSGPSEGDDNTATRAKKGGLTAEDKELMPKVREGLRNAKTEDKDLDEDQRGWRTPMQLGIPGAAIKRMVENGAPLEAQTVPNGHFFPETGTRYRIK